jgi:hypothetical protein
MTTQNILGPFMTLILTHTASARNTANAMNPSPAGVANSFLFARLVNELRSMEPTEYASASARVFRIGSSQDCRVGL